MRQSPRHPSTRLAALYALLLAAPLAHAVSLSPRGTGQVLIYPYYTVNGGQNTLLSLVNNSDRAKALKLHFREGYNGRDVLGFNLYLAPYDVWTGVVFALSNDGGANLLTDDTSCTVPALRYSTELPVLGDGRRYVPFSSFTYFGTDDDTGSTSLTRTREGSIEVIEMGEILDGSPSQKALTHVNGVPRDCASLVRAWDTSAYPAYWVADANTDMSKPGGGLYGNLAVVNPAQGTIFQIAATALDGFSVHAQHAAPLSLHPDLGDARSSAAGAQPPYADADVMLESGPVRARYVGADRTVDAVSAVLMADSVVNEYIVDATAGANTDWVLTYPTKRHYTDFSLVPNGVGPPDWWPKPFVEFFGENTDGVSRVEVSLRLSDREGRWTLYPPPDNSGFLPPPPPPPALLSYAVNVIAMSRMVDFGSASPSVVLASSLSTNMTPYANSGQLSILLDSTIEPHALRPAVDGTVFHGLPVIAFGVVKYVNGNVTPGVLANYSAATPHRASVKCRRGDAPCQ